MVVGISQLPDHLICEILSHLPTEEAIKTSVLSSRWRSLWLYVPCLELHSGKFSDINALMSFGDRFFDPTRVSRIIKLKLDAGEYKSRRGVGSYLTSWIDAVVKRKIQHLDVHLTQGPYFHRIPLTLYSCESLVYLRLFEVILDHPKFVSLPCLKCMHLENIIYPNNATFEKLVSSCPVLEDLNIEVADVTDLHVRSLSLKRLTLERGSYFRFDYVPGVVIDAPLLDSLSITDPVSKSIIVKGLDSSARLDISLYFGLDLLDEASVSSRRNHIRVFLHGVSKVREMRVDEDTFKLIYQYSKVEPMPQFGCMSCLRVTLFDSVLKWLPMFLESCPNLKSLILALADYAKMRSEEMNQIEFLSVPECLLSSLEFVDFSIPFSGDAAEMKLVKYFLENSANLKKLTLSLHYNANKDDVFKELLRIPRRSSTCQVVVL